MIFEVRGVNFTNKGAELMLLAVKQQISEWGESHVLAADLKTGSYSQRVGLGLHHLAWADYWRAPRLGGAIARASGMMPRALRKLFKVVIPSEVNVILDASGFAYGDQWGTEFISRFTRQVKLWKQQGKKVILLPQAFGPFDISQNRENMLRVLECADLIFARDRLSYDYLIGLGEKSTHIQVYPDFTNLLHGRLPEYMGPVGANPCIVPNSRMLDKTDEKIGGGYIPLLEKSIEHLIGLGHRPSILVHELNDDAIAVDLQERFGDKAMLIRERDPLVLKGILGNSLIVIGSRYHALVSALAQHVPTLGTGWSHKYQALFEDYNCLENLISLDRAEDTIGKIDRLLGESTREDCINRLKQASEKQKDLTRKMWAEVQKAVQA